MGLRDYGDDDGGESEKQKTFFEFDCPECDANNPVDEGFSDGDEVRCYYCGLEYKALMQGSGRLKFREI